jgi:endoglucanase
VNRKLSAIAAAACALILSPAASLGDILLTGVSLAGAEFGEGSLPGVYNIHYTYPTAAEVDYFVGKGMNTFRLPFRWERLQQTLNGPFNAAELGRLDAFVDYATGRGAYVVLDPHNYARYYGSVIGGGAVPHFSFADFWSRLSNEYKDNEHVIFGLMNEPNTMPTEQWRDAANAAIAAIRNTGATNLILVPGNAWTGAHSWLQNWYGTPNANVMLGIVDPGDNFAFEVHQYLDDNSSGGSSQIVSATIGQERLADFTDWLHANNRKGFLGEFAVANSTIGTSGSQIGDEAIDNMLDYMETNGDVWLGWTWWAAGPWWGNYMFTLEPTNLGQPNQTDRPALAVLQPHLASNPGDYNGDSTIDAADYILWRKNDGSQVGFDTWQANFGEMRIADSALLRDAAVAEPASAILFCGGSILFGWRSAVRRKSLQQGRFIANGDEIDSFKGTF